MNKALKCNSEQFNVFNEDIANENNVSKSSRDIRTMVGKSIGYLRYSDEKLIN